MNSRHKVVQMVPSQGISRDSESMPREEVLLQSWGSRKTGVK